MDNVESARESVSRMLTQLERRGPDSDGLSTCSGAVFGHRRLAIFDLSAAGHQPMLSPDGQVSIVFNGAIYNFRELRDQLLSRGVKFVSNTDTEVLIHGYREWGIRELVLKCRGMFAFGLWDARRDTLFLVRDRLGVKPLVYARVGGTIAFASTVKALRAAGVVTEINSQAVAEFLEHGYIPDSSAIFEGAEKLPPATIAEWTSTGQWRLTKYWEHPKVQPAGSVSLEEAARTAEALLKSAVETRLFADVPVGALLSGGIDSALVCWAAAAAGARISAFTVATPGHSADESEDALLTAREIGIDLQILPMSDGDAFEVDDIAAAYAEPFATQSALGMLRVSRAIREAGIKVVLTGDGGDDVFLGYPRHLHMLKVEAIANRTPLRAESLFRGVAAALAPLGPFRRARNLSGYIAGGLGSYLRAHDGLPGMALTGLLGERLNAMVPTSRQIASSMLSARSLLTDYLRHDLQHQFTGEYLTKVDGATMFYGLEARSPFFDQAIWEYVGSLPHDLRLYNGELKSLLRLIARRRISRRVASGSKRGFTVPVERWLTGRWWTEAQSRLMNSPLLENGWISERGVRRLLAEPARGKLGRHHLWYLLVLDAWFRANSAPTTSLPGKKVQMAEYPSVGSR